MCFELALTAWTQRLPPQPVIALGYALFGIGFSLIGFAHSIPLMMMSVLVWTTGEMVFAPVTGAYVTNLAPDRYRGNYQGMYTLMWSIGMLLGPSLGTLLFQRNASVYWSSVAAAGIAGASLALVRRRAASA